MMCSGENSGVFNEDVTLACLSLTMEGLWGITHRLIYPRCENMDSEE